MLMLSALLSHNAQSTQALAQSRLHPQLSRTRLRERGQATAEYALVIVAAATLAGLVIAWAASTSRISKLLNAVIDAVIGQVG